MSYLYLSSVDKEPSITVSLVEVESGTIRASVKIPSAHFDIYGPKTREPSGGLAFFMGKLWVAGNDCIFRLEPDILHVEAAYWSSECHNIQQIYKTDGGLKVLSHSAGKIYYMDYGGEFKALKEIRQTYKINDRFTQLSHPYLLFPEPGLVLDLDKGNVVSLGPGLRNAGMTHHWNHAGQILSLGADGRFRTKGPFPIEGKWSCLLQDISGGVRGFRSDTGEVASFNSDVISPSIWVKIPELIGHNITDIIPYGVEV